MFVCDIEGEIWDNMECNNASNCMYVCFYWWDGKIGIKNVNTKKNVFKDV